jgi:broad specificity phosphatase PhoE
MHKQWPRTLWIVRHGQSAGNVARDAAEAASGLRIDIAERDVDVPLSTLGQQQSEALAGWFGALADDGKPNVVLHSPYVRAAETARIVLHGMGACDDLSIRVDERLREKEFGILDRLTTLGINHKYPELYEQRQHVGKFYFRPPGGESWCDVILRLRSLLEMITREHGEQRVLIVAHQVIVNCMRYLVECLDEATILEIDRRGDVPNCGVSSYEYDPARDELVPDLVNFVAPLRQAGEPVTVEPDALAAPKP